MCIISCKWTDTWLQSDNHPAPVWQAWLPLLRYEFLGEKKNPNSFCMFTSHCYFPIAQFQYIAPTARQHRSPTFSPELISTKIEAMTREAQKTGSVWLDDSTQWLRTDLTALAARAASRRACHKEAHKRWELVDSFVLVSFICDLLSLIQCSVPCISTEVVGGKKNTQKKRLHPEDTSSNWCHNNAQFSIGAVSEV